MTNLRFTLAGPEWYTLGETEGDFDNVGAPVGFVLKSAGDRHGILATKSEEEILPKDGQELKVGSAVWLAVKDDGCDVGASVGGL